MNTSENESPTSRLSPVSSEISAQEQVRQITQNTDALIDALRVQQTTLRRQAMNLPGGTLDHLRDTRTRLDRLARELLSRQIELRQLRALASTTAVINSSLDVDSVLNQVMDTVIQLTGAERGFIMLASKSTGALEYRSARGIDREQLAQNEFTVSNTIVNEVFNTGEPVLTDNARSDPRYQEQKSIVGYQLRSILAVPLAVRGDMIGVVYCDNRALTALFKTHELNLLRAFADQAAVAIENARLFEAARAQLAEITEIRDLMDNIFSSVISGLITLDGDDTITAFNAAAAEITGVSVEYALDDHLFAVLPGLRDLLAERLAHVRHTGEEVELEVEISFDDGQRRYWHFTINPLRDPIGQALGVVIVLDDQTEIKQREAQLGEIRRYLPLALVDNIRSEDIAALGGQEREISVVFADVRGFTSFSENLDPQVLLEIINKYLSVASDAVNLFEGVVDKYMGDAATGLFNTPLNPQTDHAQRAVLSALHMVYDVLALHEVLPEDQRLFYGIGIHTGNAVLGNVGGADRREFAAIGDAVEVAKILQENAQRGEIIISAATYEQVKGQFDCEPVTPTKTKGRDDLNVVYKIIGRKKR